MKRALGSLGIALTASAVFAVSSVAYADGSHTTQQTLDIKLGTSGSAATLLQGSDGTSYCYAGTLGFLVEDAGGSGNTYILSNHHVLAHPDVLIGDPIIHVGSFDNGCSSSGTAVEVGTLSDFEPISICRPKGRGGLVYDCADNFVDAAIAKIDSSAGISTTGDVLDIGTLGTSATAASVDLSVQKSGRSTGWTKGTIKAINAIINVCYAPPDVVTCTLADSARFVNQIRIEGTGFSDAGDSGSGVFECVDDGNGGCDSNPNAVGLLFAGDNNGNTYANSISDVYSALGIATFGCGAACGGGGTSDGGGGGGKKGGGGGKPKSIVSTSVAPGLAMATDVRNFHEAELHNLPGVVGTGISVDDAGNPVIEVYLRSLAISADKPIPSDVEGIPVRTIITGTIRAF